jgi:hypothetical protein
VLEREKAPLAKRWAKMNFMAERDPLAVLQAENARLIALLEEKGIQWRAPSEHLPQASTLEPSRLSTNPTSTVDACFRR